MFLEDNIIKHLDGLEFDNDFLNTTPKTLSMKEIINSWTSLKLKFLLYGRHCQESEKISYRW